MLLRKVTILVLIIYALFAVFSLTGRFVGFPYHSFFTPLLTLLAFVFALLHSYQNLGWKQALLLLVLTFGVSLLFECVGVATGWIYGPYHYTNKLGFKFLGLVPLLIPVAWFMITYPTYIIARYLVPGIKRIQIWRLAMAALGAVVMTAWDLAMDPMMVAGGHWVWDTTGVYFGIPLQNFWGWWLTTFVTFWLFLSLARIKPEPIKISLPFSQLAIWSYAITGFSSLLADIEFKLNGPALAGFFAMLPWVVIGAVKDRRGNAHLQDN